MKPHSYRHLIFDNGAKTSTGEKTASTITGAKWVMYMQVTETRSLSLTLYRKSIHNGGKILM
jgi:hypothetical protein